MYCGIISVEGEPEEIISVSTRAAKPRRKKSHHGKRKSSSNPYSTLGLDTFATLFAELSAKRDHIARKTGTPEALVRFSYSSEGWIPLGVKDGNKVIDGEDCILKPVRAKEDNQSMENYNNNQKEEVDVKAKANEGCENGVNGSANSCQEIVPVAVPWWSGHLITTAFAVLTASAILVRKSAMPAAAMAVVMVVGSLQRRWLGGVMCMERFIDTLMSYFSELFLYWKRSTEINISPLQGSLEVQLQPTASPLEHQITHEERPQRGRPLNSLSAPCSPSPTERGQAQTTVFSAPKNSSGSQEFNTQLEGKKDNKQFRSIVAKDDQPRKHIRLQHSDSFVRGRAGREGIDDKQFRRIVAMDDQPRKGIRFQHSHSFVRGRAGREAIDTTVGATVMMIILFFLVFYGRLCAICFTAAWWFMLPSLRTDASGSNNDDIRELMDLQFREYDKEVIMEGWIA